MTSHTLNNNKTIDINVKLSLEEESDVVKKLRAQLKAVKRYNVLYEKIGTGLLTHEEQKEFVELAEYIQKNSETVEESEEESSSDSKSEFEEDIYNVLLFTRSKSNSSSVLSKPTSKSRSKSVPSKCRFKFRNNKILGSGAYGCVISNPISNKNYIIKEYIPYNDIDNNDIGKIYIKGDRNDEESFNEELDILLKIKKIDPFNYFTVKLKAAFNFHGSIIAHEEDLLRSLKVKDSIINETFFQIIQENGGINLNNLSIFDYMKYKNFLKLFKKFLQGMIKLNENKLVHTDIKLENILISKTKINLIDFGQMVSAKEVYDKKYNWKLSAFYSAFPPEFFIASILLKCKNNIFKKLDNVLDIMKKKDYFDKTNIPKEAQKLYYIGIKEFIKDIKSQNLTKYNDIFTEKLALQTDIYSLSFIILKFYYVISDTTEQEKDFLLKLYKRCKDPNPYDRINIYSLYTLVYNEYNIQKK